MGPLCTASSGCHHYWQTKLDAFSMSPITQRATCG